MTIHRPVVHASHALAGGDAAGARPWHAVA